jgi:protein-L-isoaspartate(D-aspartate) O-methyltransferase
MLALVRRYVRDERVVEAMAAVPRERFVPADLRSNAYDDCALGIGERQTISQPLIVALMTDALALCGDERVLEVGTGSGYQAAVLSHLAREVITVERIDELRERAAAILNELACNNVHVFTAGDVLGSPERAPYDAIIVTAGAPHVPRALVDQLSPSGRMVLPVGDLRQQELIRVTLTSHGTELARLGPCAFVPLIGEESWAAQDGRLR